MQAQLKERVEESASREKGHMIVHKEYRKLTEKN